MLKNQFNFAALRKHHKNKCFADHFLINEVADRILSQLELMKIEPKFIINVGTNNKAIDISLKDRYSSAEVLHVDIMESDYETLNFDNNSVDLIVANIAFTWTNDIDKVFAECFRVLRKGGLFIFTLLGVDTFAEMRAAMQVNDLDHGQHLPLFNDMHNIGDSLINAKFLEPVMDMEHLTLRYKSLAKLIVELKNLTGPNVLNSKIRHCFGKNKWQAVCDYYRSNFTEAQRYRLTLEIIYGHAWVGGNKQSRHMDDKGEVLISVDSIRSTSEPQR